MAKHSDQTTVFWILATF